MRRKLRPRLSPSTAIATVALVIATSGTAIAAGEIITQPSQIANRVVTHPKLAYESVDGFNLVDGRVGTQDLAHPTYGLKVDANGEDNSREIVTKRITYGRYEVTIPGRSLERCAVVATPRRDPGESFKPDAVITVSDPTQERLDTVTVTTWASRISGNLVYADLDTDMAFNLVVSC